MKLICLEKLFKSPHNKRKSSRWLLVGSTRFIPTFSFTLLQGDFLRFLYPEGGLALKAMGGEMLGQVANTEPWYMVAVTRGNG